MVMVVSPALLAWHCITYRLEACTGLGFLEVPSLPNVKPFVSATKAVSQDMEGDREAPCFGVRC